jgi:hypothetical protein
LSSFLSSLFFSVGLRSLITLFAQVLSPNATTAVGMAASAIGTAATDAAVGVTPGPAPDGEPQTPEGVPKDVVEDYEEEPEVAPGPVPEVVREEAPVEGAMIVVRTAATPPPSRGT